MLGRNENRAEALSAHEQSVLRDRVRHYLDPSVPLGQVDERLRRERSGFDPEKVRKKLMTDSPFDEERVEHFQVRPFDMRYAYVDTTGRLWSRPRPLLVAAAKAASDFLLVRRRAPRALDGAAFLFSRCLVDQHAMHKDAYVIPFLLGTSAAGGGDDGHARLFEEPAAAAEDAWRPNLSQRAVEYLASLGITDVDTDRESASLLWLHVLAIGFSPLYVEENNDAVRSNWPRVPLPDSEQALLESARLGAQVAVLLDLDTPVAGVDAPPIRPPATGRGHRARRPRGGQPRRRRPRDDSRLGASRRRARSCPEPARASSAPAPTPTAQI